MKKTLVSIVAVAFIAMVIANAYAPCTPAIGPPPCICGSPGFTPGFWKHNIQVRLRLTKGAYSAFEGGPRDGQKLTDALMDGFLADINTALGTSFTFDQLLAFLKLPGWSADRTNTANWFNYVAGYDVFED